MIKNGMDARVQEISILAILVRGAAAPAQRRNWAQLRPTAVEVALGRSCALLKNKLGAAAPVLFELKS